jgi:hypothetical protein
MEVLGLFVERGTDRLVGSTSNNIDGAELNSRCVGLRIGCVDFGGLLGFRYLYFRDANTVLDPNSTSFDQVTVHNNFYGGQAGFDVDAKFGSFFIYTRLQLALGDVHPDSGTQLGHVRDRFGAIPEVNVKLGYQFTTWLRASVGYDALSVSGISSVNGMNPGTIGVPPFLFEHHTVDVRGLTFGVEMRF